MLRRLNALGCTAAAVMLSAAAAGQQAAPAAASPAPVASVPQVQQADPAPPGPAKAMELYRAVDEWVRQWRTPMDPMGQAPLPAAAVTLRYQGSVVGRGVAVASQPEGAPGVLMIATSRAMNEARDRLPLEHDAVFEESLKAAANQIAITVEVAGRLIPMEPDQYADVVGSVAPGLEGVAVRMGDKIEAMFPETMLATGTDAAAAIRALVAKVSDDPALGLKEPKDLRASRGAAFYRFKVAVVGQAGAGKAPEFFHRGGRVARLSELTGEGLRKWADELAAHLIEESRASNGSFNALRGTVQPVTSTSDEQSASSSDRLFCSRALAAYAAQFPNRLTACDAAFDLFNSVATESLHRSLETDVVAFGSIHFGMGPPMRAHPSEYEPLNVGPFAGATLGAIRHLVHDDGTLSESVPPALTGLFAYAAAVQSGGSLSPASSQAAVRQAFLKVSPGSIVAQMPWLGWAELRLHATGDVPSAPALREMRSQLWAHQLRAEDLSVEDRDLAGGIVFTTTRQPLPTWQAARPIAFVATMLGDPRLTEDRELATETVRLLEALRYLWQLTAEDAEAHMYKDPARAIGGVRASVFDQRMPPEATAMTLMAVCETIRSLDEIKRRQAAASK